MKKSILNNYIQEILSFSDDENQAIIESNKVTFERLGQSIYIEIIDKDDRVFIKYNEDLIPYRTFLAKILGRLDLMAEKIVRKYEEEGEKIYVDADAICYDGTSKNTGEAKKMLKDICSESNQYATKICFVTADAGHGKTVLLRQYQYDNAKDYLHSNSDYIFWHIDLHGRDLVRLNEAMMYEVGSLRMGGLYYNSILTLIRNGLLVLAIDGFDELAAEIGGEKVLGSLANIVDELDGQGILIAASRRTFFNTQDYFKRTRLLRGTVDSSCEFDELKLNNWSEKQCVQYLSYFYDNKIAKDEFDSMSHILGEDNCHPILERPFLFVKLVLYAYENKPSIRPSEFLKQGGGQYDSVNAVINAFIKREVQKWTCYDNESGKPYLNFEQHVELLMEIANEMWSSQKNYITVETVQYLATILIDSWNIQPDLRAQIIRMVESHAFLVVAENGDNYRRFDHDEFKDYFLACKLNNILTKSDDVSLPQRLRNFLFKSQIQESVAMYLYHMLDKNKVYDYVGALVRLVVREWRPSYIQSNVGVLIPYLLNDKNTKKVEISNKITFSSIIFENKSLNNISFRDCNFINISFKNTSLEHIYFHNCSFSDIRFKEPSSNSFMDVVIDESCTIGMITKINDEDESDSEYSPESINTFLQKHNILRNKSQESKHEVKFKRTEYCKTIRRFLNKFVKSTNQYEENLRGDDQVYYSMPYRVMIDDIIPLLEKYNIIKIIENKNSRQCTSKAWALDKYDLDEIYKAEYNEDSPLFKFWEEARALK